MVVGLGGCVVVAVCVVVGIWIGVGIRHIDIVCPWDLQIFLSSSIP